jgi:hypothetical protein
MSHFGMLTAAAHGLPARALLPGEPAAATAVTAPRSRGGANATGGAGAKRLWLERDPRSCLGVFRVSASAKGRP